MESGMVHSPRAIFAALMASGSSRFLIEKMSCHKIIAACYNKSILYNGSVLNFSGIRIDDLFLYQNLKLYDFAIFIHQFRF